MTKENLIETVVEESTNLVLSLDKLVDVLADLFNETGPDTPEEIEAILRESGFDSKELALRMQNFAKQTLELASNLRNHTQEFESGQQ